MKIDQEKFEILNFEDRGDNHLFRFDQIDKFGRFKINEVKLLLREKDIEEIKSGNTVFFQIGGHVAQFSPIKIEEPSDFCSECGKKK